MEGFRYLEYPSGGSPLAETLAVGTCDRDAQGLVSLTNAPGLGVKINLECVRKYRAPVRIEVSGKTIFSSVDA
jgi:hypothetical protein